MKQLTIWDIFPDLALCGKSLNEMSDEDIAKYLSNAFNSNILFVDNLWVFKVKHTRVTAYKQDIQRSVWDKEETVISIGIDCKALQRGSYFCVSSIQEAITRIQEETDRYNTDYQNERMKNHGFL